MEYNLWNENTYELLIGSFAHELRSLGVYARIIEEIGIAANVGRHGKIAVCPKEKILVLEDREKMVCEILRERVDSLSKVYKLTPVMVRAFEHSVIDRERFGF